MFIKEIIIDGFKSYAYKTEIKNFDSEFNAITGLNGSGKSNILDAICFVLGISNLSQVRVNSLQELIYKNGQAGITKATVSVIFDNLLKIHSPVGFENCDEIIITRQIISGGKNKYLINGYNSTNSRVNDIFRSVNLNVNNPHFLIMQGRITKVLNMKSMEILSLIEETVGTKLYDTKRNSALKIIDKKDTKLEEIHKVIKEEIMPMLEKLNNDKSSYLKFQKISQDLDHYDKIYKAFLYYTSKESLTKQELRLNDIAEKKKNGQTESALIDNKILLLENVIQEIESRLGKESGNTLGKLETKLSELMKQQSKIESKISNTQSSLEMDKGKLEDTIKILSQERKLEEKHKIKVKEIDIPLKSFEKAFKDCEISYEKAQTKLEACNVGLFDQGADDNDISKKGELLSLNQQLINLKSKLGELQREREQSEMKIQHAKSVLSGELEISTSSRKKPPTTKNATSSEELEYRENSKLHQSIKKTLDNLRNELQNHEYTVNRDSMENDQKSITFIENIGQNLLKLEKEMTLKEGNYPQIKFTFEEFAGLKPNSPKIKGKIMNLIESIGQDSNKYIRALEVAAGGKLNFVVLDTEQTGKDILKYGKLAYRTTFIPLNKITPRILKPDIVRSAIALGGGNVDNVCPLIDLINFSDQSLKPAMEFVFGMTFLCKDIETAKLVAFHPSVRQRCVTLDGDIIEPQGTISGEEESAKLSAIDKQIVSTKKDISDVEKKLVNVDHYQESQIKAAQLAVERAKSEREKTQNKLKDAILEFESINMAIKENCQNVKTYEDQINQLQVSFQEAQLVHQQLTEEFAKIKNNVDSLQQTIEKERAVIVADNKEINAKLTEKRTLAKRKNELQLLLQKLEQDIQNLQRGLRTIQETLNRLLAENKWIKDECIYFGKANTIFDFPSMNMLEMETNLVKLKERKQQLSRVVNNRALSMLETVEEKYKELMSKKMTLTADKRKIEELIKELDDKKRLTIQKAHLQVNKDFGSIFSTLLPGTSAKLVALEGQTILQGLEIKVSFNDVWKESLSELSGGQRSLIALSLILALLLFKPAPIYILDEIDAALDASHTQNIGIMLSRHFKQSQFIVVSLKDGMFQNANVLFKTALVEGRSIVTRYTK